MGGLVSAIAWFDLGVATAVVRLLFDGAAPGAVDASLLTGPLVAGWLGLAVLASATHLIPAVGPGDASAHARQRTLLGRWALVRLAGLDGGVAALSLGLAFGIEALAVVGAVLLASALLVSAGLLVMAVALGLRGERVP
jgi:hypothetical protein